MRRIQPLMSAIGLADVLGQLETEGAIVWAELRLRPVGRAGVRLLSAEVGLPRVGSDGTMLCRNA